MKLTPERLETTASVTLEQVSGNWTSSKVHLNLSANEDTPAFQGSDSSTKSLPGPSGTVVILVVCRIQQIELLFAGHRCCRRTAINHLLLLNGHDHRIAGYSVDRHADIGVSSRDSRRNHRVDLEEPDKAGRQAREADLRRPAADGHGRRR